MRKTIGSVEEEKRRQKKASVTASKMPPPRERSSRAASKTASSIMKINSMDFNDSFNVMATNKNGHELVECQQFFTEKGAPFLLFITIETLVLLSAQSHLHRNEVIGFLSGWKMKNKSNKDVVIIHEAHPCLTCNFDDDVNNVDYSKNVEMEPESASKIVE